VSDAAVDPRPSFTRLDVGILIVLVAMAVAGVVGLIAVLDADSDIAAVGTGFGVSLLIFQAGAAIACALACLARARVEILSLGVLVAAALGVDLFVLAIWLEIDSEWYGKLVGVAVVWALFGLVALGLTLAVQPRDALSRWLYLGTFAASVLAGGITTILILTTGGDDLVVAASPVPFDPFGNDELLRPLAAILVVLAALWLSALAASRVDRAGDD
jgi:hypothetical protein